ncbi:hypothetical protein LWI28_028066 [Acer negundo]|uniref:Uncharacterized protein n=1 Tax=Acer negundo TaxID=4023 RepID=A0AAD5IP82_ACENE|nr:hypothetical protein LWI28_028066 [Acer negundo]
MITAFAMLCTLFRLQNILTRTIHLNKSIDLNDVNGSDIVRQVEGMGWHQFVTKPRESANLNIVRGFYASMIPNEFLEKKSVKVRDVDVFIRSQEINAYYETTPHDDLSKGIPKNNIFRLYDLELATALRREMDNRDVEIDTYEEMENMKNDGSPTMDEAAEGLSAEKSPAKGVVNDATNDQTLE